MSEGWQLRALPLCALPLTSFLFTPPPNHTSLDAPPPPDINATLGFQNNAPPDETKIQKIISSLLYGEIKFQERIVNLCLARIRLASQRIERLGHIRRAGAQEEDQAILEDMEAHFALCKALHKHGEKTVGLTWGVNQGGTAKELGNQLSRLFQAAQSILKCQQERDSGSLPQDSIGSMLLNNIACNAEETALLIQDLDLHRLERARTLIQLLYIRKHCQYSGWEVRPSFAPEYLSDPSISNFCQQAFWISGLVKVEANEYWQKGQEIRKENFQPLIPIDPFQPRPVIS